MLEKMPIDCAIDENGGTIILDNGTSVEQTKTQMMSQQSVPIRVLFSTIFLHCCVHKTNR